jgi:type II secretory pathway component GspD/PulD (secretin)
MYRRLHPPLLALLLSWLLACPVLPAQSRQADSSADDPHALVKPDPKRAKKLVELGDRQADAGSYVAALAAYDEAVRCAPFDVTIVGKAVTLRSKLLHGYVDNAEKMAVEGDLTGATQQLAEALHIDPSNDVLLERLKQLQSMREEAKNASPEEPPEGLPQLKYAKEKKSFRLQTDVKSAYDQVAAAYGIKAAFDPDLPARNVRLRLEDVDFDTAMKILALETGTFWNALNSKLIFVAADTSEKRKAFDTVIEQTFPLPDSATSAEMADIVKAVRDLTGAQRIQQSLNAHSVTVRDTVPRVRLAGAIIKDLEQSHGEVLLEFDLLEIDRNNAMQVGITPPSSLNLFYLNPSILTALSGATTFSAAVTILDSLLGLSASSSIPSFLPFGGGSSTFLLTLPNISADFAKSLSVVRSGRQVLLRAEDTKAATFFLGERYPITLSLLSASLGGGSSPGIPTVGGTSTNIQTEQFTVGQDPVSMATADFRNLGSQDLAVANQVDNSITILLNQGTGVTSQFAQATGSPIILGPTASSSTSTAIVSPAVALTVTSAALQSIAISPATASLAPSGTQQYSAIGTFSDGSTQDITEGVAWTSSNTAVASIGSQTGLATGQGAGTTQITATMGSVASAPVTLTGTSATLQSIAVTPASASMGKGGTVQLTATGTFSDGTKQNVTASSSWNSSNTSIASVGVGLVRGGAAGTVQITSTIGNLSSPVAGVTVTSATLSSIAVTPVNLAIAPNTPLQFTATGTFTDGSTQNVTGAVAWASSKTSFATIGASSGLATGVAAGTTSITATQGGAGSPVAIATGSVNSLTDSFPDLVVASQINNSVIVLLGNGDGTFTNPRQAASYVVGNQPSGIVLGTFNTNTDGNLDFVVPNFADNTYSVFLGNGNGAFTQVSGSPFHLPSGQTGPIAITSADFNGDGKPDLAIVNESSNNVTVLEGNGDGTFTPFPNSPLPVGNFPVAISSGTLEGSTGPALAIANQNDNTVSVYLGNGDGTFLAASQSPLALGSAPSDIVIADLANTGAGGIAVTSRASGTVTAFAAEGNGLFSQVLSAAAGTNPGPILVESFTGNSYPDVAIADDITGSDGIVLLFVSPASYVLGAASGQTAYPGSEYQDIGLKIKATPYVHPDNEVTLLLEYELKALSGNNNNGIPIISNESVTQTVRLKEGETSIVSGLIDNELTKSVSGIPGLANLPYAGYLFGLHSDSATNNELLILITPRKLRASSRDGRDIYAGRGDPGGRGASGGGAPAAAPPTAEPAPENPAAPGVVPGAPAAPAQPNPQPPAQPQPNPDNPAPANPDNQPQPNPQPPAQPPPNQENPPPQGTPPPNRPDQP